MIHFLPALLSILSCWKCLTDIGTKGCAYWFLSVTLRTAEISAVPLGVIHEALEAIPQQQTFPIVLCLRDQRQQYISQLGSDFVSTKEV